MKKYVTEYLIKHNGVRYQAGTEIELDENDANPLLEINSIKINPDHDKGNGGAGGKTPVPNEPKAYEFLKDAEQVDYINGLSDEEFTEKYSNLLEHSKTKAKKSINARIKTIWKAE